MKLTKKQILEIKPNETKQFQLDSYKACESIRNYTYRLVKSDPIEDIVRYEVNILADNVIQITAHTRPRRIKTFKRLRK